MMALRFRKRIRIAKGLNLNLSWSGKRGVTTSATAGVPGANVNIGKKGSGIGVRRGTLGVPGSGVSSHKNFSDDKNIAEEGDSASAHSWKHWLFVLTCIGGIVLLHYR
ncbi:MULTISPECIES: DUF4236 domain-containing protein [unclassified Endozoicomonas]|uniref:DUF4236 domain-containing protein n=1 Tax=unclassified Endozoicomonas TaxID=2644528 RepID=UPI003BB4D843